MELEKTKVRINQYAKEKNIDIQVAWDTFFFDEFIRRLSKSKYKNIFVFKGGFFLQNVLGVETRSTMDLDFKCSINDISQDELLSMFNKIIDLEDCNGIQFSIVGIEDIQAETKYGGKTIKVEGRFYNVKKIFGIDIGLSDIVTPEPIIFNYVNSITGEAYNISAYSIESIIAEKFETLISKGTNNSRSKDLLDLYLLNKKGYDKNILNEH